MANLLATGAAWLTGKLQASAATTIAYRRHGVVKTIVATVGQSQFEQDPQFGIVTITSRDYLFPVADLEELGEPERGDTITDGENTYQVLALTGEPMFRYSDHGRTRIRVHTKLFEVG